MRRLINSTIVLLLATGGSAAAKNSLLTKKQHANYSPQQLRAEVAKVGDARQAVQLKRDRIVRGGIIPQARGVDVAAAVGAYLGGQLRIGLTQTKARGRSQWHLVLSSHLLDNAYGAYAGVGYNSAEALTLRREDRGGYDARRLTAGYVDQESVGAFLGGGAILEGLGTLRDKRGVAADHLAAIRLGLGAGVISSKDNKGVMASLALSPSYRGKELRRIDRWFRRLDAANTAIDAAENDPSSAPKLRVAKRALERLQRIDRQVSQIQMDTIAGATETVGLN
ncbi:MAG: hypothetical protein H6707_20755 [Deltaproteobacteria bacterium]|nr:hypothetical protein [Deltaproteobacteria bacterium]